MRQTRYLFIVALGLASTAAVAQLRATASVQLIARVPPRFSFVASPAVVSGASGTVSALEGERERLLLEGVVVGTGEAVAITIPLAIRANVASFLVRADVQGRDATGHLQIQDAAELPGALVSKPASLAGNNVIALVSRSKAGGSLVGVPVFARLEVFLGSVAAGQSCRFSVILSAEPLRR